RIAELSLRQGAGGRFAGSLGSRGRPTARAVEPADGVWGHRRSAVTGARRARRSRAPHGPPGGLIFKGPCPYDIGRSMRVVRPLAHRRERLRRVVLTLGNFDG